MVAEVCFHIAQPDDLVAEVTFSRPATIYQFVRGEAGEQHLRIIDIRVGLALLRNYQVTELTQDRFCRAGCCSMLSKMLESICVKSTSMARLLRVEDCVMFMQACQIVTV